MAQGQKTLRKFARALPQLALAVAVTLTYGPQGVYKPVRAVQIEAPLIPTVHPIMMPSSALPLPLKIHADETATWVQDSEQRLFVRGGLTIELAYRTMHANEAAIWLTPVSESGENAYDVAIYLHGAVRVQETDLKQSTVQLADELLVTSRIMKDVQLSGTTPISRFEKNNPVVARGEQLRMELLTRPAPEVFLPTIVIQPTEIALQRGWIARGPGNRIISGPGDVALTENGLKPVGVPKPPESAKPKPAIFATGDKIEVKEINNERVTMVRGAFYLMYHAGDGKTPYEFRAQKAVLFSAGDKNGAAGLTDQTGAVAKGVTGAYLEGDVTLNVGSQEIHAERLYFDFTSQRAIMLDAVLVGEAPLRNVPIYMRAKEIRQLARGEYAAKSAKFSTSEFYEPHYHIGASDVYLQDITPKDDNGRDAGPAVYGVKAKDATIDIRGVPIFYWPDLSADTSESEIPLRRLRIGNSTRYGTSIETGWDIFGLAGQRPPTGVHAELSLDYYSKRGPAGGIDGHYELEQALGLFHIFGMEDNGNDDLGATRQNVTNENNTRGRLVERHRQELDDNWTIQLEASYVSDVNFLEEFFGQEFDADKEEETSVYLKRQEGTSALGILGKFTLMDFVTNADLIKDQFTTEKLPEVKYWRIGDKLLDTFTYYSETGAANVRDMISNKTPADSSLQAVFPGVPENTSFRDYLKSLGWTDQSVLRGDTRQEIDVPLTLGDAKIVPYITGRATAWDTAFPENQSGNTTRLWGAAGVRANTQFWRVYDDVNNNFMDVHRLRHIIEPEFNAFVVGTTKNRNELQPFDEDTRDVEQISDSSAIMLALHQRWQTKRGGAGHWRNVDYLVWNVSYQHFWHMPDENSVFAMPNPLRGTYFASRPELSLVANSINTDVTWRVGEFMRILADASYNTDESKLETVATGLAVDQNPNLSYFIGNRYVSAVDTDEWTIAVAYQLTRKYSITATESYDINSNRDIISALTLTRRLARFNASLTVSYDADSADTSVVVALWPEGLPPGGSNSSSLLNGIQK